MSEKKLHTLLERIGCALAYLRVKKGFSTKKEFAKQYGLPAIQYWRIERGKTNIRLNTLMTLLAIHELELQEFFMILKEQC
jgi:transcriptional regulator with XRE-family HTH domain